MSNIVKKTETTDMQLIEFPYAEDVIKEKAELYDKLVISDNKSYEATKAARTEFVTIRTSIDKALKQGNKPLKEQMDKNKAEAKRLTELAAPTEEQLQQTVKAWEQKKEEEKQAKIKAERERAEAIQQRISIISQMADIPLTETVVAISELVGFLEATEIDESFEEFIDAAEAAKQTAMNRLLAAKEARQKFETEEATRAAELARIEKERAELAEATRIAEEKAKAEAAAKQAELDAEKARQDAILKEQNDKLEKDRAALEAEREALEAEKRERDLIIEKQKQDEAEKARLAREAEEAAAEQERHQKQREEAEEAARVAEEKAKAAMPDFDKLHLALIEFKKSLPVVNTDQGEQYKTHLISVLDSEINDVFKHTSKSDEAEAA